MAFVNNAIKNLVKKEFRNKDGQYIKTVRDSDKALIEDFLNRLFKAYITYFDGKNNPTKNEATRIFCERLARIDAIRIDAFDQSTMPIKIAFDDMRQNCNGKLEGGLFMPDENEGIILLDMDFLSLSKAEAIHTLIHEFIHALTTIEDVDENGKTYLKSGIRKKHDKVLKHFNEGITETIAQILWMKMYKNVLCPGFGRYALEVRAVRPIIEMMGEDEFVKTYLTNPKLLEEKMKEIVNDKGENLYDFILSFDDKDLKNVDVKNQYFFEIENFKVTNEVVNSI